MSHQIQNQTLLNRALPLEDKFPLASLLDTSLLKSTFENLCLEKQKKFANVEIDFVRYNPGVSCIICYRAAVVDRQNGIVDEALFYAGSFAEGHYRQFAQRLGNQSWAAGTILTMPQRVDGLQAIFYQFPNDSGIPGLKLLAEPEKLMQLIVGAVNSGRKMPEPANSDSFILQRLRYKPENRFIARCEFNYLNGSPVTKERESILLRFERVKNAEKSFELSLKLHEAFKKTSRIILPRPLFFIPEHNFQAFEWIEAEKFSELLRGSDPESWLKRAALVLAELHSCQVSGLPQHEATFFERRIQHTANFLAYSGDESKNLSGEIAERLNAIPMSVSDNEAGLVHGDFHQGQLLVADRRDVVLDFSRSYFGDCTADVGNFLAQLRYWHIIGRLKNIGMLEQHFVEAYECSRNVKISKERLKYWKTFGLFELAMREFRRLKPGWPTMCEKLLVECQNTLDA